jgi:hypothetical protein
MCWKWLHETCARHELFCKAVARDNTRQDNNKTDGNNEEIAEVYCSSLLCSTVTSFAEFVSKFVVSKRFHFQQL